MDHPVRFWRRTKREWCCLLKTKRGCCLLHRLLPRFRISILQDTDTLGPEKVCLGSAFAEHNRLIRNVYQWNHSLFLLNRKRRHETTRTIPLVYYSNVQQSFSSNRSKLPFLYYAKSSKRIELPTHSAEVNYRTLKAVVFYGPERATHLLGIPDRQ